MSQTAEVEKVKALIRKLSVRTMERGCHEAEAMAAAERVGQLLDQYSLSMAEVDLRQEVCVELRVENAGKNRRPIDNCLFDIARFCDCKVWRDVEKQQYVFFGLGPDTEMAGYLYNVIAHAMTNEIAAFKASGATLPSGAPRGRLRSATTSFLQGMSLRVARRLRGIRQARDVAMEAAMRHRSETSVEPVQDEDVPTTIHEDTPHPASTSLMVVKQEIVEEAYEQRAAELNIRKGPKSILRIKNGNAYRMGQNAANKINLSRPIDQTDIQSLAE